MTDKIIDQILAEIDEALLECGTETNGNESTTSECGIDGSEPSVSHTEPD